MMRFGAVDSSRSFVPDVAAQKAQEVSSTFPTTCVFGDSHSRRRRTSRLWRETEPRHFPRRCALFDQNPTTDSTDWAGLQVETTEGALGSHPWIGRVWMNSFTRRMPLLRLLNMRLVPQVSVRSAAAVETDPHDFDSATRTGTRS